MQAKKEQSPEAGPTPITVEYADSKGKTQKKSFDYGSGADRQGFYDGVHDIREEMDKATDKSKGK